MVMKVVLATLVLFEAGVGLFEIGVGLEAKDLIDE